MHGILAIIEIWGLEPAEHASQGGSHRVQVPLLLYLESHLRAAKTTPGFNMQPNKG